jgi:hypothetical protein
MFIYIYLYKNLSLRGISKIKFFLLIYYQNRKKKKLLFQIIEEKKID